jgi:formyl-CoA transferase
MLDFQAARWLMAKEVAPQAGNNHPTSIPTGVFKTADGHMNIAAAGDDIFHRLCRALNAPELIESPDYRTDKDRLRHRDQLNAAIEAYTVARTSNAWIEALNAAGVPCGPIYAIDEMFADPQVKHLGIATPLDHPTLGPTEVVGQAVVLSRTPWELRSATPERGEHNDQILGEIGYSSEEIASLKEAKVV